MLTRDQILALSDVVIQKVVMPEWGGEVFIRTMTGEDFLLLESMRPGKDGEDKDSLEKTIVLCTCNELGERLFTEADIPTLKKKSFASLQRLAAAILAHNSLTTEGLDDAEKN